MYTPSRNEIEGFTIRTRKNLEFIREAYDRGTDVHVVTQLVLSLLGLVVFPFERFEFKLAWPLAEFDLNGRSTWRFAEGSRVSLDTADLLKNLRHAIAHCNIEFSSDDRHLDRVTITFWNDRIPARLGGGFWRASAQGDELLNFCLEYLRRMENSVS